jgi:hypothetical protein
VQKEELTFLVRGDQRRKNISIEGVLPETQFLDRLMLRGMAEMYIPRFVNFLERKDLISLTLKQRMTRAEFTHFIDVMSEPSFVETRDKSDKERFCQALNEKCIFNISYLFNEELLAVRRKIPWRAQLALSRLRKDLKTIPLYLDLDVDGMIKVRREIIQDVIRPIRGGEVIYHILMNSDLAETDELKEDAIDRESLLSLSGDLLLKTSQTVLKETLRQRETGSPKGKLPDLVGQIASVLNQREIEGAAAVLEAYFKAGLISFERLPAAVQRKIKLQQVTDKFLKYSTDFFERFDRVQDREKYLKRARAFTKLIPELIQRDRYEEIHAIISHIDRHFNERKHLSIYAGQVLEEIGKGPIPLALKEKFLREKKETRLAIAPIFLKLHVGSVPYLLSVLRESDDKWIRKHACELLVQIGSSAIHFILGELDKKEIGVEPTIDIIRVLGEIEGDERAHPVANLLRLYLTHEDPRLREEALGSTYRIRGSKGEQQYLDRLDDPEPAVRKKAIQCLAGIRSETALATFLDMLCELEESPSERNSQVEARLFAAIGFYENVEQPKVGRLEDFLLESLDRRFSLGPLKFLKKKKNPLRDDSVSAICESLGSIGTGKSVATLQKLEKQRDSLWENKAREALKKIAERSV